MRVSSILSSLTALAIVCVANAEGASDVLDLTPSNFKSIVDTQPLMLVEFFAPWCGHCKALAPHYEEAATALKDKNIKLAKVNCVDEADLCQEHGVQGYPTLRVFRNGEHSDYTGPRKTDGIVSYMVKQSLPPVSEVTAANHDEFRKADSIVAVLYVPTSTDLPAPEFSATADKHRDDYLFGIATDKDALDVAGVTGPSLILYRSFDEPRVEYPYPLASAEAKDIEQWISNLSIPYLDEVGAENYAVYAESGKPLAYLFVDPTDEKLQDHLATLKPLAKKYHDVMNFVWIDAVKFGDHAKALNLAEPTWPAFVIQDLTKQLKYPYDQSVAVVPEKIEEMVEAFKAGKLEPQLKSQPIPETQDESVLTVVGKQFDEIVFDEDRDVFVEFYATWCGHCKRLKPIWDQLGDHFKDLKDRVTIAKMEATENDIPPSAPFRVSGFPTLKFKPAGSREFIDYSGDRSLEHLIAFVEENAKNSLDRPAVNDTPTAQEPLKAEGVVHEEL